MLHRYISQFLEYCRLVDFSIRSIQALTARLKEFGTFLKLNKIRSVQVQINTVAPALGPQEIEQGITFPVEQTISGLPGLNEVRSISKLGLSQVTVIFQDGTDIYLARQLVMERLQTIDLPEGTPNPEMVIQPSAMVATQCCWQTLFQ